MCNRSFDDYQPLKAKSRIKLVADPPTAALFTITNGTLAA